ncbi:MAG: hypothetical protein B2I18_02045 [Cuniculiplasma sp. C_DKE]|nr:MAG: hypothetical protein B2I18_02045 [Cuniculiplasma sp. C_DKE]
MDYNKNDHKITVKTIEKHIKVSSDGVVIAETDDALMLSEQGHGDTVYIPVRDAKLKYFKESPTKSKCPYKGTADYYSLNINGNEKKDAVWRYIKPSLDFIPIKDYMAFDQNSIDKIEM